MEKYVIYHITSSQHFPEANVETKSAMKIAKRILKQPDVFITLSAYPSTPISAINKSPVELLVGRKIRTR